MNFIKISKRFIVISICRICPACYIFYEAFWHAFSCVLLNNLFYAIVTLEEHVSLPEMISRIPADRLKTGNTGQSPAVKEHEKALADITGERLTSMDDNGITLQVLSVVGAGAQLLEGNEAVEFAKSYNNIIAGKIAAYPGRFAAFAHLPMTMPAAAAVELKRCVNMLGFKAALINGLTNNEFLDNEKFSPVLQQAEALDVPLYLHPGPPPAPVANAYYSDLPESAGNILSLAGWGWHSETAIHILRMIVAGTFDRFPNLKVIIGHMGEMLSMMMARCDTMFRPGQAGKNKRSVSKTLKDQVYITTSGIFTQPPFVAAMDTFGIDRILFSVDYPFAKNEQGTRFINELKLNDTDLRKLLHGNADRLLKLQDYKVT